MVSVVNEVYGIHPRLIGLGFGCSARSIGGLRRITKSYSHAGAGELAGTDTLTQGPTKMRRRCGDS